MERISQRVYKVGICQIAIGGIEPKKRADLLMDSRRNTLMATLISEGKGTEVRVDLTPEGEVDLCLGYRNRVYGIKDIVAVEKGILLVGENISGGRVRTREVVLTTEEAYDQDHPRFSEIGRITISKDDPEIACPLEGEIPFMVQLPKNNFVPVKYPFTYDIVESSTIGVALKRETINTLKYGLISTKMVGLVGENIVKHNIHAVLEALSEILKVPVDSLKAEHFGEYRGIGDVDFKIKLGKEYVAFIEVSFKSTFSKAIEHVIEQVNERFAGEYRDCLYGIAIAMKHDYIKGIALIKALIRDKNGTWTDITELIYSKMGETT